ncbi:MAG: SH3 domain-containing protein [Byssovorax cruenta]
MIRRFLIFLLVIIVSSCNSPETSPTNPPAASPLSNTPIATVVPVTETPIPIETLLALAELPTATETSTSTPSVTLASPREQPVNCRVGPDISYAIIGALLVGNQAEVIGKNPDITWLYVRNPSDPSNNCWLSVDFINVDGPVELLPVVGPPEIMVTSVKVSVEPPAIYVACDAFPQNVVINTQITTNGPTIVSWFWQSNIGKSSPEKQVLFEAGDSKLVQDYYQIDRAGDYSMRVQTLVPNIMTAEATFKAICTP